MKIIKFFFIKIVQLYKIGISPWIGKNCRYLPTCSDYMIQSLKKENNILKAILIGLKRIIKCNPFGDSGFDPPVI
ncbi:membrane protein insertion efficiency factor YidD [Blattabacterium cuenoti]|uniref:membrane protein insertion efficiency factor YidD n=1 Tax=Blattabacterium cuenoti TaxID=1653831 RepID=UPI00163B8A3A|nr:membrane protein insertion efficiency factor YidD [Blattabacterium cuenoti]